MIEERDGGHTLVDKRKLFIKSQTDPMIMLAEKDGAMIILTTDPKLIL